MMQYNAKLLETKGTKKSKCRDFSVCRECVFGCPDRYIMYREGTINQFSQRDGLQNFYYNCLAILAVLFSNILFSVVDIIIYCSYWSFLKSLISVQD